MSHNEENTEKQTEEGLDKPVEKKKKDKNTEKIHALEDKLQVCEAEKVKLKNDYFKAYADAENIKKRNQQDLEMGRKYRIQSFALEVLPVIDNLERSLSALEDKESGLAKGILMTYNQLIEALKKEGVEEIDALNKPFDANFHQALMMEKKEDVEANIVIEILQKGYVLKDRLLRPALVKVSE